jgi:pimeloyl-ACP methyl ester carboxylesterase
MLKIILTIFLAGALALSNADADLIADRITVTVHGQGSDVVLIPGLTCPGAEWDTTVAHLQSHYRVHVVEIDGFGGVPAQANAQGPVVQPSLDALDAYIKANHLAHPYLIGHSLGGTMGLMLAQQHPEDVGKLMVVDALPFSGFLIGAMDVDSAKSIAAKIRENTLKESQDDYARGETNFIRRLVKSPDNRQLVSGWAVASDKAVVAQADYDDMVLDLRPQLAGIHIPITVVYPWDTSSPYSQADTDSFYQQNYAALPGVKMVRIDGSDHFIMLDQPEKFLEQVDAFLK